MFHLEPGSRSALLPAAGSVICIHSDPVSENTLNTSALVCLVLQEQPPDRPDELVPLVLVVCLAGTMRNRSEEALLPSVTRCRSEQGWDNQANPWVLLVKGVEYGLFPCRTPH